MIVIEEIGGLGVLMWAGLEERVFEGGFDWDWGLEMGFGGKGFLIGCEGWMGIVGVVGFGVVRGLVGVVGLVTGAVGLETEDGGVGLDTGGVGLETGGVGLEAGGVGFVGVIGLVMGAVGFLRGVDGLDTVLVGCFGGSSLASSFICLSFSAFSI